MTYNKKFKKEKNFDRQIWFLMILLIAVFTITSVLKMDKCDNVNKTIVEITTNKGIITAEIYTNKTPMTSKNFLGLVEKKFYDGLTFHRYEPGFVIQGGDPNGDGTGGSNETIPLEITDLKHEKGVLAMARSNDPDSASSQFYITLDAAHFLDGNYAVFGKVLSGMDNVMKLRVGDIINSIRVQEYICD